MSDEESTLDQEPDRDSTAFIETDTAHLLPEEDEETDDTDPREYDPAEEIAADVRQALEEAREEEN